MSEKNNDAKASSVEQKVRRFQKKRNRVEELLDQLELDYIMETSEPYEYKPNGFENRREVAEKILAEFGIAKPKTA